MTMFIDLTDGSCVNADCVGLIGPSKQQSSGGWYRAVEDREGRHLGHIHTDDIEPLIRPIIPAFGITAVVVWCWSEEGAESADEIGAEEVQVIGWRLYAGGSAEPILIEHVPHNAEVLIRTSDGKLKIIEDVTFDTIDEAKTVLLKRWQERSKQKRVHA